MCLLLGPSTGHCLALLQGIVVWLLLGPSIRHCCLVVAWPFYRAALFGCCLALLQGIVAWPFYRALLFGPSTGQCCLALLQGNVVWHFYSAFLLGPSTGHFCLALLQGIVESLLQNCKNVCCCTVEVLVAAL